MENTNNNNTTNEEDTRDNARAGKTPIGILDEEIARRGAYGSEAIQSPRIGTSTGGRAGGGAPAEDKEIAKRGTSTGGRAVGEAGGGGAPAEDKEIAKRGTSTGGRAGGGAPALMDTIHINSSIEDRIRILSTEMIRRGLETEESFKRLRSYEKQRNEYRCLMEELARYYDRQTALGLPIEQLVLKTGVYMQHIILV
jgi:hypothetical protein